MKTINTLIATALATLTFTAPSARITRAAEVVESAPTVAVPAQASSFHADFEVDPTAYILDGFSLHVGLGWKRLRVDLGNYAMGLPQGLSGNDDFKVSFDGYGVKAQYFLFSDQQKGGFVGIDGGVVRTTVGRKGTDLSTRQADLNVGMNLGWRFPLGANFYATTWLGLGYSPGRKDVTLGGSAYAGSNFLVFPAVHLGYRFH